jgi:hypothetical protein
VPGGVGERLLRDPVGGAEAAETNQPSAGLVRISAKGSPPSAPRNGASPAPVRCRSITAPEVPAASAVSATATTQVTHGSQRRPDGAASGSLQPRQPGANAITRGADQVGRPHLHAASLRRASAVRRHTGGAAAGLLRRASRSLRSRAGRYASGLGRVSACRHGVTPRPYPGRGGIPTLALRHDVFPVQRLLACSSVRGGTAAPEAGGGACAASVQWWSGSSPWQC